MNKVTRLLDNIPQFTSPTKYSKVSHLKTFAN